jgi:Flp pilus assembly protein TadD
MKRRIAARRPPFSLLPLLLLVWGLVVWGMVGCGLLPTPFGVQGDTASQVAAVKAALDRGDTRAADLAMERWARALVQAGATPSAAYAAVGATMTRAGQGTAAARFLERASKQAETSWDPMLWSALAEAYRSANNRAQVAPTEAEADRRAEAILSGIGGTSKDTPSEAARRQMQAGLYYSGVKNDTARALRALREAYRLQPDDPETINALGYTLADKGTTREEIDEAVVLTRRAAKMDVDNPALRAMILDSFGWALFKRDDKEGARRVLRQAADLLGDNAEVHYHLGVVYGALGQTADAELELNRALQIQPKYPEAEKAKASLHQPPGKGVLEGA